MSSGDCWWISPTATPWNRADSQAASSPPSLRYLTIWSIFFCWPAFIYIPQASHCRESVIQELARPVLIFFMARRIIAFECKFYLFKIMLVRLKHVSCRPGHQPWRDGRFQPVFQNPLFLLLSEKPGPDTAYCTGTSGFPAHDPVHKGCP